MAPLAARTSGIETTTDPTEAMLAGNGPATIRATSWIRKPLIEKAPSSSNRKISSGTPPTLIQEMALMIPLSLG